MSTETDALIKALGDCADEVWESAGEWEISILDTLVTVTVKKLLTGDNAGKYMTHATHGAISEGQASPYQSVQLANSIQDALTDWGMGIRMFAGKAGAKMVAV